MFKFLSQIEAVYLKKIDSLVIADLHIGIEEEFKKLNINIGNYIEKMKEKILKAKEICKCKNIIVIGDIKHEIGIPKKPEKILDFFNFLNENFEDIRIVKGNHDGLLEKILKDFKVYSSRGFKKSIYGFFHGNSYPKANVLKAKYLFCSHLHPKVAFPKDYPKFHRKVFLILPIKKEIIKKTKVHSKIIVLPSFNPFIFGIEFEEAKEGIIEKIGDFKNVTCFDVNSEFII